jgi:hypothetical protein
MIELVREQHAGNVVITVGGTHPPRGPPAAQTFETMILNRDNPSRG